MDKCLHKLSGKIIFIWLMLMSFTAFSQIYVGAWNPIRYPNTGVCGWAFQDNGAAGTITDPFASIEHALKVAELNGSANQTIYILPDAYVQRYDYDSIPALDRDNCDGHDLDYAPTVGAALSGLQIIGSTSGCLTFLDAIGTSNALSFLKLAGASNITISNIYFKGYSQAISINNSSNITFTNCVFEGCNYGATALDALLINSTSSNTSVVFSGCKFVDNNYNTTTSAINIQSNSTTAAVYTSVDFTNCEFVCNSKDNSGGAVYINGRSSSTATPTTVNFSGGVFANNVTTSSKGGAIYIGNNCSVNINGTYFLNNKMQGGSVSAEGGAAIHIYQSGISYSATTKTKVIINNALFYGNRNTYSSGYGGAIALRGTSGATTSTCPELRISNTIFEANYVNAGRGGAIYNEYGRLVLNNCLLKNDTASGRGGGIWCRNGFMDSLKNCTFYLNSSASGSEYRDESSTSYSENSVNVGTVSNGGSGFTTKVVSNFDANYQVTSGGGWIGTYINGASMVSTYNCSNGYCAAQVAATCLSNQLSDFICTLSTATGSISGIAFNDVNQNGLSDDNNVLDSVYIILYDAANNVIARYTTKANGTYSFSGLPSGTYSVAFTPKAGLSSVTIKDQNPGSQDSDIDNTFYSMPVTINTGLTNTVNDDNAVSALNFQNVSAGFTTLNTNVLPLELISFSGEIKNCSELSLIWETASEFNVDYFEVLGSDNGNLFYSIDKFPAKGNNNNTSVNTYSLNILQNNKIGYYKLKMVDLDGTYKYSQVNYYRNNCQVNKEIDLTVYPNPSSDFVNLLFNDKVSEEIIVSVTDQVGHNITEQKYPGANGMISMDLGFLPAGTYLLSIKTSYKNILKKIQKL